MTTDSYTRDATLFDGPDTREKATVMSKWDVMMDDSRNPEFDGLEEWLEWGATYRVTIEKISKNSS